MSAALVFVDDTSPDLDYSGQWVEDYKLGGYLSAVNETVTGSYTDGASVSYGFQGGEYFDVVHSSNVQRYPTVSGIAVYMGTYYRDDNTPPSMAFAIDGQPTPNVQQPNATANGTSTPYFALSGLSADSHTISITMMGGDGLASMWLDAILLQTTVDSEADTSAALTTSSFPTSTVFVTQAASSKVPIGPIVGGVVGGVAVLVVAIIAGVLLYRRKNKQPYYYAEAAPDDLLSSGTRHADCDR